MKKSYIELIAVNIHPKNSTHLRSHLRAIMALDHSRLGLEDKIRPNFFRSTCLLYKILPTSLGTCKQPFILFIHHIWGETVPWGAVFIIQTSVQYAVFHNFAKQIALIQYSGWSKHAWALKKIQNHLFGLPVLTFEKRHVDC